ncbi:MAG: pantoate--beta-alanine ligase [Pseudomonadota bacterium]
MNIIKTVQELRAFREPLWLEGKTLSFVPTMGALHEGHLKLVEEGQKSADICLPYIFLNPTQFAEGEDLDAYPKTLDEDVARLESLGVTHLYAPTVEEVYPSGFQIVRVSSPDQPLEGEYRPHFFDGVCTVVLKMLMQCSPDIALFGEKDFQQLQVIKDMVKELNIPVEVKAVETVRDDNGLALSSRNQYLSEDEYQIAIYLNQILKQMVANQISEDEAIKSLLDKGFGKVDYCTYRNSDTFLPDDPNRVLAAAWIGTTRLIDNMAMVE